MWSAVLIGLLAIGVAAAVVYRIVCRVPAGRAEVDLHDGPTVRSSGPKGGLPESVSNRTGLQPIGLPRQPIEPVEKEPHESKSMESHDEDDPLVLWRKGLGPFPVGEPDHYEAQVTEEEALRAIEEVDNSARPDLKSDLIFNLAVYPAGRRAVKRIFEDLGQPEIVRLEAAAALAQRRDCSGVEFAKQVLHYATDDRTAFEAALVLYFACNLRELIAIYNDKVCGTDVAKGRLLDRIGDKAFDEFRDKLASLVEQFKFQTDPLVKGTLGHQFWHVTGLDDIIAVWEKETDLTAREWLLAAISTHIGMETRRENLEALSKRISHFEIQALINKRLRGMDMAVPDRFMRDK
jgi:hypothetical protein